MYLVARIMGWYHAARAAVYRLDVPEQTYVIKQLQIVFKNIVEEL